MRYRVNFNEYDKDMSRCGQDERLSTRSVEDDVTVVEREVSDS